MERNPIIVVTGAIGGIGSEVVRLLAVAYTQCTLYLIDHPSAKDAAVELARELISQNCVFRSLDVADLESVQTAAADIVARHGRIDVLVNAAGIMPRSIMRPLTHMSQDDLTAIHRVMDVNFWGGLYWCHEVLPVMRKNKYGRIVNIASIMGCKGDAGNLAYAASKAAIISLTQTLACEAPFNKNRDEPALDITVNAVAPGVVETSMTKGLSEVAFAPYLARNPQRRKVRSAEIAHAVLYLASKEASAVNGTCLIVDGGYLPSS